MKQGECSVCEGWIYWNEALILFRGEQFCEKCYEETK